MRAACHLLAGLLALAVAGCAAYEVRTGSNLASTSVQANLDIDAGAALRALAIAAALGALFGLDRARPDTTSSAGLRSQGMAQGRAINVQDCTRPIEQPSANLLCR